MSMDLKLPKWIAAVKNQFAAYGIPHQTNTTPWYMSLTGSERNKKLLTIYFIVPLNLF